MDFVRAFLEQAFARHSRSTVMNPLAWLIAVLFGGLSASLLSSAPGWLLVFLILFLSASIVIFLVLYIYFAFKAPDLLRSEKHYLTKMAIEKSARGDNLTGLIDPTANPGAQLLAAGNVPPAEEKE